MRSNDFLAKLKDSGKSYEDILEMLNPDSEPQEEELEDEIVDEEEPKYDNEDIDIELLKKIKKATNIPFVLHGGSGVPEDKIKAAIKEGVNIINIGSDIKIAFSSTLKKTCKDLQDENDPRNLLRPTIEAVKKVVLKQMELFGCTKQIYIGDFET